MFPTTGHTYHLLYIKIKKCLWYIDSKMESGATSKRLQKYENILDSALVNIFKLLFVERFKYTKLFKCKGESAEDSMSFADWLEKHHKGDKHLYNYFLHGKLLTSNLDLYLFTNHFS